MFSGLNTPQYALGAQAGLSASSMGQMKSDDIHASMSLSTKVKLLMEGSRLGLISIPYGLYRTENLKDLKNVLDKKGRMF